MDDPSLSHPDEDGGDTPTSQSRKRKAANSSGRGVATLTPEQLAKKRANDREAQRAIRERTKNTIETLERRIQDLTQQQPYQELQAIIRQKDAIQAENDEIRRRLASIMAIIQPVVGAQGLTGKIVHSNPDELQDAELSSDLATAAQHNVQLGLGQQNNVFQQNDSFLNGQGPRSYPNQSPAMPSTSSDPNSYPSPYTSADQDQSGENHVWHNSRSALNHQRDNLHRSHELSENGERLNFNFLLENINKTGNNVPSIPTRHDSPTSRSQYPAIGHTFPDNHGPPVYAMLPKNCASTCPLDSILLNFLQARQRENASGNASSSYISPAYPSVSSLLNPTSTATIDPLSQLMTDIISKFPNISGLPEQAATLFFMFLYMRWQIYPTQENYDRLPEWLTPRPSQLFTAHPAWIDHLPWPRMRDKVIASYHDYPFENWFLPFTSGLSVNWPYEPIDCLISTRDSEDPIINPVFERHIRRLENWSIGPKFIEEFPSMSDCCRVREDVTLPGSAGQLPSQGPDMVTGHIVGGMGSNTSHLHQRGAAGQRSSVGVTENAER